MSASKRKPVDSPAIQLLSLVWNQAQRATRHSWLRLNHALQETTSLAVRGGLRFDIDDFVKICNNYRPGCWMGDSWEWFYRLAVLYGNRSAWKAYEAHCGRVPFIWKAEMNHRIHWAGNGDGPMGKGLARLVIGAEFDWRGHQVVVTSFNDTKGTLTACAYQEQAQPKTCKKCGGLNWSECSRVEKIDRRFTISHQDLKDEAKARRTREKAKAA